jgi:hypothetical protein
MHETPEHRPRKDALAQSPEAMTSRPQEHKRVEQVGTPNLRVRAADSCSRASQSPRRISRRSVAVHRFARSRPHHKVFDWR